MLADMEVWEFEERLAAEVAAMPKQETKGAGVSVDDPEFARKVFGVGRANDGSTS